MTKVQPLYKDDEYYTPKYIVDMFAPFDYDPATNDYKAKEFNIPNYDTIETDGLKCDWTKFKRIWCNPPFTMKREFFTKAQECYDKVQNDIYIYITSDQLFSNKSFYRYY